MFVFFYANRLLHTHTRSKEKRKDLWSMGDADVATDQQQQRLKQVPNRGDAINANAANSFDDEDGSQCLWHRRSREVHAHLKRRVAGILTQIRCTSSANHFDRHRVEVDELLRCDAPMGFTPSMILAGVPDIIHLLTDAVRDRRVLEVGRENRQAISALTPICQSSNFLITPNPFFVKEIASSIWRDSSKFKGDRGNNTPSNAMSSVGSNGAKGDNIDCFLPPLVRHAKGSAPQEYPHTTSASPTREGKRLVARIGKSNEVTTAAGTAAGSRKCVRDGSSSPLDKSGPTLPRIDANRQSANRHVNGTGQGNQPLQQQSNGFPSACAVSDAANAKCAPLLCDIPSTVEAMMYHCAFPLVCITPEDYESRASATHILVSTLSSIIRKTSDNNLHTECEGISGVDNAASQSTSDDGKPGSNINGDYNCNAPRPTNAEQKNCDLEHKNMLYRLRRAALHTLHALLSIMDSENASLVNKHFAERDRQLYDAFGDINFSTDNTIMDMCSPMDETRENDNERVESVSVKVLSGGTMGSPRAVSPRRRLSTACVKVMQRTQRNMLVRRVAPLSVYNNAVDVNVLIPLLERWTFILDKGTGSNGVLDSARFLTQRPGAWEVEERSNKMANKKLAMASITRCGQEGHHVIPAEMHSEKITTGGGRDETVGAVVRMCEKDVEEIYLLLRICLQLSLYKHHLNVSARMADTFGGTGNNTFKSIPVLVCLTMARCMEGDRHLPLCVECLWNMLDVIPEEAAKEILHHTGDESGAHFQQEGKKQSEYATTNSPLSRLSATEALLHCLLQFLVSGHRLEYRELRNDIIVLMLIVLRTHTAGLRQQEETLLYNSELEHPALPPGSTIEAITTMAKTVFDLVCGPELQVFGTTAELTLESPELFRRYHTVLSPTTRRENLQFKVLGWRFLEAFHEWQNVRLTLELRCRPHMSRTTLSTRAPAPSGYVFDTSNTVFDVCGAGFVDLLLMYVDTECSNELVLAWSREDLLTLQEESWRVILAMVEPHAEHSVTKAFEGVGADHTWQNGKEVNLFSGNPGGGLWVEGVGEEWPLLQADLAFVGTNGIACAMRYIQETCNGDTEMIGYLAIHVLSVLSRFPIHREALLALRTPAPTTGEPVPLLLATTVQVIQRLFNQVENSAKINSNSNATRGMPKPDGISRAESMQHVVRDATVSKGNYGSSVRWQKDSEGRKKTLKESQSVQTRPVQKGSSLFDFSNAGCSSTQRTYGMLQLSNTHVYFPAQTISVFLKCLSLLHNVADGSRDEVVATQRAFILMDGITHILRLVWNSLTPSTSNSKFSRFQVEERNKELLAAALNCVRVFLIGNEAGQAQFVRGDGVNTLLTVIEAHLGEDSGQLFDTVEGGHPPALHLTLTILADLLRENAEARDAFLKWFNYTSQVVEKADDGKVNAVQLLLRLWNEGAPSSETHDGSQRVESGCDVSSVATTVGREPRLRKRDFDYLKISTTSTTLTKTYDVCEDIDDASAGRPAVATELRPSSWGLNSLGLQGRELVTAALWRRYADLERMDRFNTEASSSGELASPRGFRELLSAPICKVLGLRVGVYACLAALGFERISEVKASPSERVKLLHIAALEALCKDEVWGAIAESVDLAGRVVIRAEKRPCTSTMGSFYGGKHRNSVSFRNSTLLVPIIPDADKLVSVLADVDTRAREMKRFEAVTLDMQGVHNFEDLHRSLLAFVRHDDKVPACTIAEQFRNGCKKASAVRLISPPLTVHTGSEGAEAMNDLVTIDQYPTLSGNNAPTTPMGSWRPYLTMPTGFSEKKRKKEAMIKNSFKSSKAQCKKSMTSTCHM
ncbi:hypothetical protein, conserved [Trypanosoma brucei gambiense DAL972]|uniref:Uncharacterized protein n=1 Tax=Trypanosoma brucei gambiense (strain MHOM/CI/86/DAL972) TaxID=679716 RepID=D0A1Z1_TRYB9|nr:hypothetical protein, conserved [Trypanosoma brucei gambiense DAL972]CBH15284.1 hypothetical protein, conserved [Trypanosoma brucei gambiense DAL972]|eukprot:XP_011777549.1 hypothetical protein, conserved [Trypanosoma brucei gambiense DAL972]